MNGLVILKRKKGKKHRLYLLSTPAFNSTSGISVLYMVVSSYHIFKAYPRTNLKRLDSHLSLSGIKLITPSPSFHTSPQAQTPSYPLSSRLLCDKSTIGIRYDMRPRAASLSAARYPHRNRSKYPSRAAHDLIARPFAIVYRGSCSRNVPSLFRW